jgi:uncharacterized protein YyaL (SSP411 family)
MTNHLANENSPYLLQHAANPVHWYPWGPEALEKALTEEKPIFLSIGYAACHWCHVMAHESFEDADTAALMNEYFVNIKVDREERPDLDSIYMQAVVALTGSGGWPMSVFLTPQGIPFLGGTYFPPVRRYNMPSFRELLLAVAHAWKHERQQLLDNGQQLLEHVRAQTQEGAPGAAHAPIQPQILDDAAAALAKSYDWAHGGWGRAPKFPQPMAIEFLLRKAIRGDAFARDIATHALKEMAKGGMYDVVGGGFSRYSTDDHWRTPHFEKMLYDNAQLALVYLHAWLVIGEESFRQVCEETLDFLAREMIHPLGGFYSSLDADSEGEEGKFYIWTPDEIQVALNNPQDVAFFTTAYNITSTGNFEGKNILQRALTDEQLAMQFGLAANTIPDRLNQLHIRLLTARSTRLRPATDDKILTAWNALALTAFAEAARYLKSDDYLNVAIRNAEFMLENLFHAGRLLRSWREGQARHNAYLEDYAALILALLSLYQADPNPRWFQTATQLADDMLAHFTDPSGGFFDTRDDHEALITRPKDLQDNATPCGNSMAALALLQLAAYTGESRYRDPAETSIGLVQKSAERYPTAFANWLCASDFALGPVQEVVIVGEMASAEGQRLRNALWGAYRPRMVAALVAEGAPGGPPLTANRPALRGRPTAYVCYNFACQQPTTSAEIFGQQLQFTESR